MKVLAAFSAAATVAITGTGPAAATTSADDEVDASAVLYWALENENTGECLATYQSGAIRSVSCDDKGQAGQWHWIRSEWNSDYRLLKNRWTGKCLIGTNPVTSGSCEDWTSRHWDNNPGPGGYYLLNAENHKFLRDPYWGVSELDVANWSSDTNIRWQMRQVVEVRP
ncbi:hypothetical protein ABZ897_46220 [Nonomuraea sp. NPDC046802]|uniref:hypothetical protein n=1 Tax=Nonomuraea sp. NPDC046802 TaxID=3154919 RepID=UPI0033CA9756